MVSKRGRTTADRNKLKRRLRELIRINVLPNLLPIDMVVYARIEAYDASFMELRQELQEAVHRITRTVTPKGQA